MYDAAKLGPLDPLLTGFSTAPPPGAPLAGDDLAPVTDVPVGHGHYLVFGQDPTLLMTDANGLRREPGGIPLEIEGGAWSSDTFRVKEYALAAPVFDEEREEMATVGSQGAAAGLNPERDAVQRVSRTLLLHHEKVVSDLVRNTATYPGGNSVTIAAGVNRWDDASGGSIISDVRTAIGQFQTLLGYPPNVMWMSKKVFQNGIMWNPKIQAFYNVPTNTTTVGDPERAFRALTGYDGRMLVLDSKYNSANNVDATPTMTSFWGTDVGFAYVDPSPGQRTQTFLKTFCRPYGGQRRPTYRRRDDERFTDVFTVKYRWDVKVVMNTAGYLIKTAVA